MKKQKECCSRIVQQQEVVSVNGERIRGESCRGKCCKCPVPVPVSPPPCNDSQDSLYYTPASTHHCDERPPKTHRRLRKRIDVHITDRNKSKKRLDCIPTCTLSKIEVCPSDYSILDRKPRGREIRSPSPCTDSTSSDDFCQDQRKPPRICKPERCSPPIPPICCERPVNLPQREKSEVRKECCDGANFHISVRPKSKSPARGFMNCQPVMERKTTDCCKTVQTEFIRQSHKACQVSSRAKIATIDITSQTEKLSRAVKESQIGKSHWDKEKRNLLRDQCLQTQQEENEDDDDSEDTNTRARGHAFPFVGETPSGYLKIAKHMVAFENKNIGILVADQTKTKLWHKELKDCEDQLKGKSHNRRKNDSSHQNLQKTPKQNWCYSTKPRQLDCKKVREHHPRQSDSKTIYYTPQQSRENYTPQQIESRENYTPREKESRDNYSPEQKESRENYLDKVEKHLWGQLGFDNINNKEIMDMITKTAKQKFDNAVAKQDDAAQSYPPTPPTTHQLNDGNDFQQVKESELSLHEVPFTLEPSASNLPSLQGSGEYLPAEQKETEINAAVTIQRHVKGFQARKHYNKIRNSAKLIQGAWRGHLAREQMKADQNNSSDKKKSIHPPEENEPTPTPEPPTLILGPYLREDLKVPRDAILVLGGSDPTQPISTMPSANTGKEIYMYSINSLMWTNVGALPEPRTHFGIAKIGYEVYIIGGCDPRYQTSNQRNLGVKSVWKVHLKTGEWYFDSNHPRHLDNPRSHFGCAGKEGKIYMFGGNDAEARALSTCQKYDTLYNIWSPIQAMDGPRVSMGVAVYENHIWLAGGLTKNPEKPVLKSVIYYDTVTDSWTTAQHHLPLPRAFSTLVVAHDKLFMVGGAGPRNKKTSKQTSLPEILVMNKTSEQWREAGALNVARHGHAAVAIDHQIIVLGGVSSEHMGAIDSVEMFDLSTSHSQKVRSLNGNLSGMGAVSLQ